jgi:HPt (histidine-containing phosphotransfer) domain-containing protein
MQSLSMTEKITVEVDSELSELIPLFLQTRQNDLMGLEKNLASGNFDAMRVIGHGMKGSGSSFGFHAVTTMGSLIEAAALVQDASTIKTQTSVLRDYLNRLNIEYV